MGLFKHKHKWTAQGSPFVAGRKVFIAEKCKCGMYRYIRIPSNLMLQRLEEEQ